MATLTVTATTPYSAQLRFVAASAGTSAKLKQSGATGGDVDLTSLQAGPLRACLARSSNWSLLGGKVIVRMTVEGVFGSNASTTLPYAADVQGVPGVVSITASWGLTEATFASPVGPCTIAMELRFVPSNQR
jgi:hypothetical protein